MPEGKKQKVLIVHNYYQIPGGEDTVVANEKKLLEDHGHEVILYTRHNNELKGMSKLQKLGLPFTTIFNPRTYREIKEIIKKEQIEIVHVHNTLNLISPAVYYAAVKMKVPVVQTIHNFRFLCPGATFYRDGHICEDCVSKGLWCAVKHGCYRDSKVQTLVCVLSTWFHRLMGIYGKINYIALTGFNKEKLLQLKQIRPDKVYVKPNFTFFYTSENQELDRENTGKYYLFIGRIEKIKGVQILLDAFAEMSDIQLKLAGIGPLFDEKKTWVVESGLKNIEFLGYLDRDRLKKAIIGSKAVILPTQVYEGFPMTIPEVFSQHKPMIVSNMGNAGALIEEGETGTKFEFNSVNALIKAVRKMEITDREKLGKNAFQRYKEHYTPDGNYLLLKSIYDRLL